MGSDNMEKPNDGRDVRLHGQVEVALHESFDDDVKKNFYLVTSVFAKTLMQSQKRSLYKNTTRKGNEMVVYQ